MTTGVESTNNRVYSNDKRLWIGMTLDESKAELGKFNTMLFFNNADKDKDDIISEKEFNIYNGPSIKYTDKKGNNSYFYSGLEANSITNEKEKELFQKLDIISNDGILTEDEILKEIEKIKQDKSKRRDVTCKTMLSIPCICAGVLSIAAAIASRKGESIFTGAALGLIGGFAFSTPLGFIGGKIASSLTKKDSAFEIESNNAVATENK